MLNNVLFILLGAGLVTIGFLGAALAQRIHGTQLLDQPSGQSPRKNAGSSKAPHAPYITHPEDLKIAGLSSEPPAAPAEMPLIPTVLRAKRQPPTPQSSGNDVIAALTAAGYKRDVAARAAWACDEAERATLEAWTAGALRRCAQT